MPAGAIAGAVIPVLACPFELGKLSSQVSVLLAARGGTSRMSAAIAKSYQNKGTVRTIATIVKHRRVLGLYTGFLLHQCELVFHFCWWSLTLIVRDTLGTGFYFTVYKSGKQLGITFGGDSSNKLAVIVAGGLCGLVSWAVICTITLCVPNSTWVNIKCRSHRLGQEHLSV